MGAAALAGSGRLSLTLFVDEMVGAGELGEQVCFYGGELVWGERAALVAQSRAASAACLKLILVGGRPGARAAWVSRSRTAW